MMDNRKPSSRQVGPYEIESIFSVPMAPLNPDA